MKNSIHLTSAERGFTLVETLVAISILMISIAVPFFSLQQAIVASNASRDQTIASSLAQEGVEYVYYVRNNKYLYFKANNSYPNGGGWLASLDSCVSTNGCTVDPGQSSVAACSGTCGILRMNDSRLYTQVINGTTATPFTRTVKITTLSSVASRVTVTVTWTSAHRSYTTTVTETLYNWL